MIMFNKLNEGKPNKLVQYLKEEIQSILVMARKKLIERTNDIICREYTEESYHSEGGLERDYKKEMQESVPRYFFSIKQDADSIWARYSKVKEVYDFLHLAAPTLLVRHRSIVDGMLKILEYHNDIQKKLAEWESVITYYTDHHKQVFKITK